MERMNYCRKPGCCGLAATVGGRECRPALRTGRNQPGRRSLPLPGGGFRSIYGADALVQGTERGERFLFWPMGIPSAGAMRQWGNHATAFLGRRHFDDADLIEKRFRLTLH